MGQQQSQNQPLQHFKHRFIISNHPLYVNNDSILLLHEKLTGQQYILSILTNNDQIEKSKIEDMICKKLASKCNYISTVEQYLIDDKNSYCTRMSKVYILFHIDRAVTLKHKVLERNYEGNKGLSNQQALKCIQMISMAISWLKYHNHPHSNIRLQTIYCNQNRFILSDPWIAPQVNNICQYPSPQKLMVMNNLIDHQDLYLSDLFSLGMVILECLFGNLQGIYKPNFKIDKNKINEYINQCENIQLVQKLKILLLGTETQKKSMLHQYANNKFKSNKQKLNNTISKRNLIVNNNIYSQRDTQQEIKNINQNVNQQPNPFLKKEKTQTLKSLSKIHSTENLQNQNKIKICQRIHENIIIKRQCSQQIRKKSNSSYQINNRKFYQSPYHNNIRVENIIHFNNRIKPIELYYEKPLVKQIIHTQKFNHNYPYINICKPAQIKFNRQDNNIIYKEPQQNNNHLIFKPTQLKQNISQLSPNKEVINMKTSTDSPDQELKSYHNRISQSLKKLQQQVISVFATSSNYLLRNNSLPIIPIKTQIPQNSQNKPILPHKIQINDNLDELPRKNPIIDKKTKTDKKMQKQISKVRLSPIENNQNNSNNQSHSNITNLELISDIENKNQLSNSLPQQKISQLIPSSSMESIKSGQQNSVQKTQLQLNIDEQQSILNQLVDNSKKPQTPPIRQSTQLEQRNNHTIPQQSDQDSESSKRKKQLGQYLQQFYQNGGHYKGYVKDGKRDGEGTFYYKDGGYYQGHWKQNMMNGYGKLFYDTGKIAYQGYWYRDQFHGRGKVYNDSPASLEEPFNYLDFQNIQLYWQFYEGDLVHDTKEGFGKIMLSNGECYEGEFKKDKVHGKGVFKTINGKIIKGVWAQGKFIKQL